MGILFPKILLDIDSLTIITFTFSNVQLLILESYMILSFVRNIDILFQILRPDGCIPFSCTSEGAGIKCQFK